jgi:hypothetical protein
LILGKRRVYPPLLDKNSAIKKVMGSGRRVRWSPNSGQIAKIGSCS